MKNRKLRVAVHQMEVRYGELEENFRKIRRCLAEFDADIHILPEASTSGFQYHELAEISHKNGEFLQEIRDFCKIKKTNVALPLLMGENGNYFNRIYPVFF